MPYFENIKGLANFFNTCFIGLISADPWITIQGSGTDGLISYQNCGYNIDV